MKNSQSEILVKQIKDKRHSTIENKNFKTTDINILLNRVKIEQNSQQKKKIIFSISILSIIFFISFIVLGS